MCLVFNNPPFSDNPHTLLSAFTCSTFGVCAEREVGTHNRLGRRELRSPLFIRPRGPHRTSICRLWARRVFFPILSLEPPAERATTAIDAHVRQYRISSYRWPGFSRLDQGGYSFFSELQLYMYLPRVSSSSSPLLFSWLPPFLPHPTWRSHRSVDVL